MPSTIIERARFRAGSRQSERRQPGKRVYSGHGSGGARATASLSDVCGRVVIDDEMDIEFLSDVRIDHTEELEPLNLPVPIHARADHGTIEYIEGRKGVVIPLRL